EGAVLKKQKLFLGQMYEFRVFFQRPLAVIFQKLPRRPVKCLFTICLRLYCWPQADRSRNTLFRKRRDILPRLGKRFGENLRDALYSGFSPPFYLVVIVRGTRELLRQQLQDGRMIHWPLEHGAGGNPG